MTSKHTEPERNTKTQEIKSYLTHEISVLGKTVPTLAIAAIVMIGGASAALLGSFGTVTGTADVEQAVELKDESDFSFANEQTAGETLIETRTLKSKADVTTQIGFKTTCGKDQSDSSSIEGNEADFSGDCKGIDTRYIEYFDNAGHDFDGYEVPSAVHTVDDDNPDTDDTDSDESFATIEAAVNAVDDDDGDVETVVVKDGSYITWTPVKKSVHLVSENPQGAKVGRFTIRASDVTIQGFEVVGDGANYNGISVEPKNGATSGIVIEDNHIHEVTSRDKEEGKYEAYGIIAWSVDTELEDVTIRNNLIEDIGSSSANTQGFGIFVEDLASSGSSDGLQVSHNTIKDINDATIEGDDHPGVGVAVLPELTNPDASTSDQSVVTNHANADIESNVFASNDVDVSVAGDASQFSATSNQFGDGVDVLAEGNQPNTGNIGLENIDGSTESVTSGTVDASDNWFGTDGISTQGTVDASWKEKSDTSIEPETTDKFGVVNEFAINLRPADYSLTTSIIPAGAEETTN
jgi:hypothetical protein